MIRDIDDSKAPLLEHLIELRRRLLWCVATLAAAFFMLPLFRQADLRGAGPAAARRGAGQAHLHRHLRGLFRRGESRLVRGADDQLPGACDADCGGSLRPAFMPTEKKAFLPFLLMTPFFFARGAAFAYFLAMPWALHFLLSLPGRMSAACSRRRCQASAIICRFYDALPVRLRSRLPARRSC